MKVKLIQHNFSIKAGLFKRVFGNRKIVCFMILTFFALNMHANANRYLQNFQFRTISFGSGIKNTVYNIEQDTLGYVWLWTKEGLIKYDGFTFEKVLNVPDNPNSLSSNIIRNMLVDSKGDLWVTTAVGLNRYNYLTGGFTHYLSNETDTNTIADNSTYGLAQDKNGYVWISGWNKTLCRYDRKSNSIKRYHLQNKVTTECYRHVYALKDGKLCLFTDNNHIIIFDPETSNETILTPNVQDVRRWKFVFEDKLGYYFFASCYGNYALYNTKTNKFENYADIPKYRNFTDLAMRHIYKDKNGNTLISTNKKLIVFDANDNPVKHIISKSGSGKISNINASFLDVHNNLWLGLDNALEINGAFQGQIYLKHTKYVKTQGELVASIEDSGDTIYNLYAKGINKYEPNSGFEETEYFAKKPNLLKEFVSEKGLRDKYGNIWLNTFFNGAYCLFGEKLIHYNLYTEHNIFGTNRINKIALDSVGNTWISTYNNGLFRFKGENSFEHYEYDKNDTTSVNNNWFFDMYVDKYKQLWFASWDGLAKYNYETNSFQRVLHNNYTIIYAIRKRNDSTLYLATDKGVWVFNVINNDVIKKYSTINLLPDDYCTQLEVDKKNRVWVTTKRGITIINESEDASINLNAYDGVTNASFRQNLSYQLSNGNLVFNNLSGQYIINPEKFTPNPTQLKTNITGFKLFNKPVRMGELPGYDKRIEFVSALDLKYEHSYFSINYAAIGFSDVQRYSYQYKLENYNNSWIDAGSMTQATYTNLDPGKYVFKVRCINEHNVVGEIKELKLHIIPPLWMEMWFKILVFFVIIILVILIFRWRLYALEKKKGILESMVQDRTKDLHEKNIELTNKQVIIETQKQELMSNAAELETQKVELKEANDSLKQLNVTKDKFFSIISHDLKNPFNALIGFSELLLNNFDDFTKEKKIEFLEIIHQTAENTSSLLENLLHWSRSQTGNIYYVPKELEINSIVAETINLFESLVLKKQITIINSIGSDVVVYADDQMIKTVFRNLIANAIKYSNKGGTITLYSSVFDTETHFSVVDTGIGMDEKTLDSLFKIDTVESKTGTDNEMGTGLGLILCSEFINCHSGKLWAESTPGKGSTFHFSIPIKNKQ